MTAQRHAALAANLVVREPLSQAAGHHVQAVAILIVQVHVRLTVPVLALPIVEPNVQTDAVPLVVMVAQAVQIHAREDANKDVHIIAQVVVRRNAQVDARHVRAVIIHVKTLVKTTVRKTAIRRVKQPALMHAAIHVKVDVKTVAITVVAVVLVAAHRAGILAAATVVLGKYIKFA